MEQQSAIRRQLGAIMVEEGFLTPQQLEEAIAEQHRRAKPLGQVLVELGLASAGAIANALAEQHGGLLKTEFGISVGLHPIQPPGATPEERQLLLAGELDALRDQCVALRRGVAVLESELERLRDSL